MPDRNFDDLAERFSRRIYGGLKGQIRLAVLQRDLDQLIDHNQQLNILDIGSGLSQIAIDLAVRGHNVSCNDLSANMLEQAKQQARIQGVEDRIHWLHGPYQQIEVNQNYDVVMCHALLEWVERPQDVVEFASRVLRADGLLSLCFYNPDGKTYRNLIRGNFDWLDTVSSYRSDDGSLTPNNPSSLESVKGWLKNHTFQMVSVSGIRVFHDYVVEKRGGHANSEQVLQKELEYSDKAPYLYLSRYLHICARSSLT